MSANERETVFQSSIKEKNAKASFSFLKKMTKTQRIEQNNITCNISKLFTYSQAYLILCNQLKKITSQPVGDNLVFHLR